MIGEFIKNSGYYSHVATANTLSDVHISAGNAESISAFYTCVRIKSETMEIVNTYLESYEGKNKKRATDHRIDYLLSTQPNSQTNACTFWGTTQLIEDIWGNAYAEIKRAGGNVISLHILPAWEVEVVKDHNTGKIWYYHNGRQIPSRNILHFKQNSNDGVNGRSLISLQKEKLGIAKKQENYAAKMVGSKPPAVFEGGEGLNQQTAQGAAESFAEQIKKGIIPIAYGGLKYKNIMMPAGDIQLFEMMGATAQGIYEMFRMPMSKGGKYGREEGGTYNTVEQQNINFVQDVVMPMIAQKVNECNIKLFTRPEREKYKVYFDLTDLLKSDLKTLTDHLKEGWTRGWYTANEVREKLNENPIEGPHGDRHYVQAGFIPADKVDEFINSKQKPAESTPKEQLNGHHQYN